MSSVAKRGNRIPRKPIDRTLNVANVRIAQRERRTRSSARILVSINEQGPEKLGSYAGWGSAEDAKVPPDPEGRTGPAMMPFLRHRAGDRWWRLSLPFLWLLGIIVVITVEDWLHIPQGIQWISLGVLFVGFVAFALLSNRRLT